MYKSYPFSTNLLGYTAIAMAAASIVIGILAVGLPYWERSEVTLGDLVTVTTQGLWMTCVDSGTNTCTSYSDIAVSVTAAINAVRALVIIGVVAAIAALVLVVLATFPYRTRLLVHFLAAGVAVGAGLFFMLSMAVFIGAAKNSDFDIDVCISLVIVSWLTAWLSAAYIAYAAYVKHEADK